MSWPRWTSPWQRASPSGSRPRMRAAQSASAAGSRCAKRANASRIDLCHRGQGRWRPSAIDAGLDLSRQSAGAKHQRWLLAQNRQKICTFHPLHRPAAGLRPSRPARRLAVLAGRLSARLQIPRLRRPSALLLHVLAAASGPGRPATRKPRLPHPGPRDGAYQRRTSALQSS